MKVRITFWSNVSSGLAFPASNHKCSLVKFSLLLWAALKGLKGVSVLAPEVGVRGTWGRMGSIGEILLYGQVGNLSYWR